MLFFFFWCAPISSFELDGKWRPFTNLKNAFTCWNAQLNLSSFSLSLCNAKNNYKKKSKFVWSSKYKKKLHKIRKRLIVLQSAYFKQSCKSICSCQGLISEEHKNVCLTSETRTVSSTNSASEVKHIVGCCDEPEPTFYCWNAASMQPDLLNYRLTYCTPSLKDLLISL